MFTGIVETVGRIAAMERTGGDLRLTVAFASAHPGDAPPVGAAHGCDRGLPVSPSAAQERGAAVAAMGSSYREQERAQLPTSSVPWPDPLALGESIAVSGVCLTVVAFDAHGFSADVSTETLACTTLGNKRIGDPVNLERALLPTTRLGGHLVAGHVDGIGAVRDVSDDGRSQRWQFDAPQPLLRFIAGKGSIAVDGVSLTVNAVDPRGFEVALIPHTVANTAFAALRPGAAVNLEVDLIARYIARLHA